MPIVDYRARLRKPALRHIVFRSAIGRQNVGRYLLSGFVFCAVCGGAFSKLNRSYRCGNHRNRGDRACTNARGIMVERLERIVIAALRERLYAPSNLKAIIARVRDELLAKAKQEARSTRPDDRAKELHAVETEIENIKQAVKLGKATASLLEMLEDAEGRRKVLLAGQDSPEPEDVQDRLERALAELPGRVEAYLEDLETLLARDQVERGKEILETLGTKILVSPDGTAEIRGDLGKSLKLHSMAGAEGFEPQHPVLETVGAVVPDASHKLLV